MLHKCWYTTRKCLFNCPSPHWPLHNAHPPPGRPPPPQISEYNFATHNLSFEVKFNNLLWHARVYPMSEYIACIKVMTHQLAIYLSWMTLHCIVTTQLYYKYIYNKFGMKFKRQTFYTNLYFNSAWPLGQINWFNYYFYSVDVCNYNLK